MVSPLQMAQSVGMNITNMVVSSEGSDPLDDLTSKARELLVLICVLAGTLIITNFAHKAHVPVPEAILIVVVGAVCGAVGIEIPGISNKTFLNFENENAFAFMLVFICPIIFAEGYGMKSREFFENISRILGHAFLGTVISTVIVGLAVHYLPPLTGFPITFTMAECLAFGALISATDPVTTLAIFKDMNMVDNGLSHLYFSVLGEAILNDAVGITLFDGFADFVKNDEEITGAALGKMALKFCITFFGSMAIGILCGIFTAMVLKLARLGGQAHAEEDEFHFNVPEMAVMLIMAYVPFLICTAIPPLSGIVAVLFAGIAMRHYAHFNLTYCTRQAFLPFVELLANLCEMYVFLLVGLGLFIMKDHYSLNLILWTSLACLVGRAVQVYPIGFLTNCFSRSQKLTTNEMHVQWVAGLRGAVAFICALCFPQNEHVQNRGYFITTTLIIAIVSMVLLGWPTPCVLSGLKIKGIQPEEGDAEYIAAGPERWIADVTGRASVGDRFNNRIKAILLHKQAYEEDQQYLVEEYSIIQARRSSAAVAPLARPSDADGQRFPEQERTTAASAARVNRVSLGGDHPWPSVARPSATSSGRPSRSKRMLTDP